MRQGTVRPRESQTEMPYVPLSARNSSRWDGESCDCCDLRHCADSGPITDCEDIGQALGGFQASRLTLPSPYCGALGINPYFEHVSGCTWETEVFDCGEDSYLWRLTASPFPAKIELIHVTGDDAIPPIVYYSPTPFSGLCGNQFLLHSAPGPKWVEDHPDWADGSTWNQPLASRICLGQEVEDCLAHTGGPVPKYLAATIAIDPEALAESYPDTWLELNGTHKLEFTGVGGSECIWRKEIELSEDIPFVGRNFEIIAKSTWGFSVYTSTTELWRMPGPLPSTPPTPYWSSRSDIFRSRILDWMSFTPGDGPTVGTASIGPA